jgi:hypothetical protein
MEFGLHNVELKLKEGLHFSFFFREFGINFFINNGNYKLLVPFQYMGSNMYGFFEKKR